jgi:inorganic pyrophosphatase/exopolyphosphatase
LKDAIFVGHLVTDLDSVAGAIGAAALYGGRPALASDINSETEFALKQWGVEPPPRIEDVMRSHPECKICLVDHQQTSQMNPAIDPDSVVGVINHHALQSKTIVTDRPIYIDIRPWGSMSTIVAHTYLTHGRRPGRKIAGMLLCAILSDTLNLQGPTTTEWDRSELGS